MQLLLESGDDLYLESGAQILLESEIQYFEQALKAKLESIGALTSIVGSAIYTQALRQTHDLGASGPALIYEVPTKPYGHVLVGSDGTATARIKLGAFAYAYSTAKQITEVVWNAIDGVPDQWGDGTCQIVSVVQQNDGDNSSRPESGSDQWTYRVDSEYAVKFRLSIPALA